ncbi:MAG: hypothetical protein IH598_15295 [Bacteroidales bacterium]|nr:hypothetical protein [Bacteroidales bacterium]
MIKFLLLLVPVLLLANCTGNKDKQGENGESQVIVPPSKTNSSGVQQNVMKTDAKPGFANKFDRGKAKRESIVDKFDQNGNLIERTENDYDNQGNISRKNRYTYRYDERQRRVEQRFYQFTPDERPVMSNVNYIKYNDKDWKIENLFIGYDENGNETSWAKNVYKHNAEGKVIEDVTSNKQGFPTYKINYNWVGDDLVSESFIYYDGAGGVTDKKTLKYNEAGTVIETIDE